MKMSFISEGKERAAFGPFDFTAVSWFDGFTVYKQDGLDPLILSVTVMAN